MMNANNLLMIKGLSDVPEEPHPIEFAKARVGL